MFTGTEWRAEWQRPDAVCRGPARRVPSQAVFHTMATKNAPISHAPRLTVPHGSKRPVARRHRSSTSPPGSVHGPGILRHTLKRAAACFPSWVPEGFFVGSVFSAANSRTAIFYAKILHAKVLWIKFPGELP